MPYSLINALINHHAKKLTSSDSYVLYYKINQTHAKYFQDYNTQPLVNNSLSHVKDHFHASTFRKQKGTCGLIMLPHVVSL